MTLSHAAIEDVKNLNPCDKVAAQYVALRRHGKRMIGPCPIHSPDKQARDSTCFECDADGWVCAVCEDGGDVIRLVRQVEGLDFAAAIERLGGTREIDPETARKAEQERDRKRRDREAASQQFRERERGKAFYGIWRSGVPIAGTPAEAYLALRGVKLPDSAKLRCISSFDYWLQGKGEPASLHKGPVLVAPIVRDGKFSGVHTTYINLNEPKGKLALKDPETGERLDAKKVRGSKKGGHIELVARDNPRRLIIGEGIEKVAAVWLALHEAGQEIADTAFWTSVDLGNLGGKAKENIPHPTLKSAAGRAQRVPGPEPDLEAPGIVVPDGVEEIVILGDRSSDEFLTRCAIARAAKRWERPGRSIKVAWSPADGDFDDQLRTAPGEATWLALAVAIDDAQPVEGLELGAHEPQVESTSRRQARPSTSSASSPQNGGDAAPAGALAYAEGDRESAKKSVDGANADAHAPHDPKKPQLRLVKSGEREASDPVASDASPEHSDATPDSAPKSPSHAQGEGGPPPANPWGYDVDEINRDYALVLMGSKAVIFHEQPGAWIEDEKRMLEVGSFNKWFENRFTQVLGSDGKLKTITWAKRWMSDRRRRQYRGIEFHPNPDDAPGMTGYLNLWSGFAVQPARERDDRLYKTFRDHLINNVCRGNEEHFKWVFGFFAHIVQRPRERLGVALVMRGKMGSGKTKIGEVMGRFYPRHYFLVDDPRYVTGQFNAHMATCILLQADEAVWAGDKAAEGRLKGLVTSPIQQIEAKGVDPIRLRNYVRLIMTSNEDWVVPAGKDERRFAVLDVDPRCAQKHEYFREMEAELANGGLEALLADLLAFDLDSIDLWQIPRTAALLEQKIRSLNSVESWWFERLNSGTTRRNGSLWKQEIACSSLFNDYIATADKIGVRRKQEETVFGITMNKLLPGLSRIRRTAESEDDDGKPIVGRTWCYRLPSLEQAREAFDRIVGQSVVWPRGDDGTHKEAESEEEPTF
jgi:hypothetical protein